MPLAKPQHKKPKRLDYSRSLYYELTDDMGPAELMEYELYYRTNYPAFKIRIGNRLFFEFDTPRDRDIFLLAKEAGLTADNIVSLRMMIPCPDNKGTYFLPAIPGWPPTILNAGGLINSNKVGFAHKYMHTTQFRP